MSNLRNTKEFREALLAAYGVTEDKDVENKDNFKKAILDALGISYTTEDIKNFEKFRALLVSSADSLADNLIAENIKKDVEILGITGSYEGGGSSDFTTAEVTITNNTESDIEIALPSIRGHGNDMYMIGTILAVPNSSKSHIVVLYKGAAAGFVITDNVPSAVCTGDISISSIAGTHFNITGNGTITFGTASEG
ncbi:MAG: hypothetical protein II656_07175 [Ruminococcus sp.]|nr:hypothetical protein [Ruminococcus sp.]